MTDHHQGGAPAAVAPSPVPPPTPDAYPHERRRLLVGDLVVRRVSYRSVSRVAWPFAFALYVCALVVGIIGWNVAALAGWSPAEHGLVGGEVLWSAVGAGVVLVPLAVAMALGLTALYNTIGEHVGGIEVAVVSPRHRRRWRTDV